MDKFINGPFYLLIKDIDISSQTESQLKDIHSAVYGGRKAGEGVKIYQKIRMYVSYEEDGTELLKPVTDAQNYFAVISFNHLDSDSSRRVVSLLSEQLARNFEFGFVSEQ